MGLEAGTIESLAPTLGGDFYRVIVDQGDFEYLTAQAASIAGDLTIDHTPVEVTGSGTVASLSATLTGTFTITDSTSGWINVVAGGGSWSYVTPDGWTWTDV